ncbi:MAG: hypothetical protein ACI8QS_002268 [Planctomycetota bacterium]|jgi:hypothetical protein
MYPEVELHAQLLSKCRDLSLGELVRTNDSKVGKRTIHQVRSGPPADRGDAKA